MIRQIKKFWLIAFLLAVPAITQAQDYKFHSVFIYNFTKYIQWPENYRSGDFVIGVLGNSPISESLEKMAANKTVGQQKFKIVKFNTLDDVSKCHILFIPNDKSHLLDKTLQKIQGQPTLVITERPGLGEKGSSINFILEDGRWKFELNQQAATRSKLKVSGELVKFAILI
ncbi:MAG: YfiR family protein [Cyclobacteriaceae bacterium]